MKYLKVYENDNIDNSTVFMEYVHEKYLRDIYGFYDYELKYKSGDYYLKLLFVEFGSNSSNDLNKLTEYLSYEWDMHVEGLELGDESERFYMVVEFTIDKDDLNLYVEDINLNKNVDKYNL